jgi:hypothetical protein
MKATLTLDFGDRLKPEESRELLAETIARQVPIETVLIEALRLRRSVMPLPQPPTAHAVDCLAA